MRAARNKIKSKFKMVIGHKLKVMEIGGSVNYKRNEENEWRGFVMVIERGGKRVVMIYRVLYETGRIRSDGKKLRTSVLIKGK